MDNISQWNAVIQDLPEFPSLKENIEVDVAIIGAGITGLTAGLELARYGKTVAIVEATTLRDSTTANSTGNLYIPVQPYIQNIIAKLGEEVAASVVTSRRIALDYIQQQTENYHIDCNFARRPWFLYAANEKEIGFFNKEVESFKKLNVPLEEIKELPLSVPHKKVAVLNEQARLNPLAYIVGLAAQVKKEKMNLYNHSRIISINETKNHVLLKTANNSITAKQVIIATHTPIGFNTVQMFTAPYRSYVVSIQLKANSYVDGQFWDLSDPHHVLSTHPVHGKKPESLLIAGSHHKTGQAKNAEEHYKNLLNYANKHFAVDKILYQWSAQHYQTADDIPYIGLAHRHAKRTYMATGYFADGLVYGTLAALILSQELANKKETDENVFNSQRLTPLASANFVVKENTNVFFEYIKKYMPAPKFDKNSLQSGEGRVLEINKEKCAVYKDEHGHIHAVSAICPHMKCPVHWNNAERTWDCPCHGSRFDIHGTVLEGPALHNLETKEII